MSGRPHVASLHVYPFKSARGVSVDSARVDEVGFRRDRRWMIVTDGGDFVSQRTHPAMAQVRTALDDDRLRVSAPGLSDLELPYEPPGSDADPNAIRVWKQDRFTSDCGEEAAAWASDFLGEPCRVVRAVEPPDGVRVASDGRVRASFADGSAALIISRASLDDLNARLDEPLPMNRFRPNVVVEGVDPYAEDEWTRVRIGEVVVRAGWPCPRCSMTTVDQETAVRAGREPLRTLATYRRNEAGEVEFGLNALFEGSGVVRVGDEVVE